MKVTLKPRQDNDRRQSTGNQAPELSRQLESFAHLNSYSYQGIPSSENCLKAFRLECSETLDMH